MIEGLKKGKEKKPKGKEKLVFAKDRKQAIAAVVLLTVLVLKVGYTCFYYANEARLEQASTSKEALMMAEKQQQNLESLDLENPNLNPKDVQADANDIYSKTLGLQGKSPQDAPIVAQAAPPQDNSADEVEIISKKAARINNGKMVFIPVANSGRSNPFLPAGESVVPSSLPKFNLLTPPEQIAAGSDADKVMGTTISGILYDKYSPSAIINISGMDYLVKKGDVINKYKVLSISKEQVIVQLGRNIYKAGVGELLAQDQINYNTVANLEKKFGGNEVPISIKKRGY